MAGQATAQTCGGSMIRLWGKSTILGNDETLAVRRVGSVSYPDGRPREAAKTEFLVVGNVQPVSGRDLLIVPEGDRFKEQYWLYLKNCQFAVDRGLDVEAKPTRVQLNDTVVRLGSNYQVQSLEDWGSYSRARIMRIDVGPQRTP
jgi:hypothetical protein